MGGGIRIKPAEEAIKFPFLSVDKDNAAGYYISGS